MHRAAFIVMQFTRTSTGDQVEAAAFLMPSENFSIVLLQAEVGTVLAGGQCSQK